MASKQSNKNGLVILRILKGLKKPATANQITQHLIKLTGINTPTVKKTVECDLKAGVKFGYIQMRGNKYFVSDLDPKLAKGLGMVNEAEGDGLSESMLAEDPSEKADEMRDNADNQTESMDAEIPAESPEEVNDDGASQSESMFGELPAENPDEVSDDAEGLADSIVAEEPAESPEEMIDDIDGQTESMVTDELAESPDEMNDDVDGQTESIVVEEPHENPDEMSLDTDDESEIVLVEPAKSDAVEGLNAGAAFISAKEFYIRANIWKQTSEEAEPKPIKSGAKMRSAKKTTVRPSNKKTFSKSNFKRAASFVNENRLSDNEFDIETQVMEKSADNEEIVENATSVLHEEDIVVTTDKKKSRTKRQRKCKPSKREKRKKTKSRKSKKTKFEKKAASKMEEPHTNVLSETEDECDCPDCKKVADTMELDVVCTCEDCIQWHLAKLEGSECDEDTM